MRVKLKIETLTPVHIGSGINYTNNIEFITQKDDEGNLWGGIIDANKVFGFVGEQNLQKYTASIEKKQNFFHFITPYSKNLKIEDITKRTFVVFGNNIDEKKDLKEQSHSIGKPIIPASSLKGALRTAILSHLIKKFPQLAKQIIRDYENRKPFFYWSLYDFQKINKEIESKYLSGVIGRDVSNHDFMRFVYFSDVLFEKGDTIATVVKVLSLRRNGWEFKEGSQLTESVGSEVESYLSLTLKELDINRNEKYGQIKIKTEIKTEILSIFSSVENLFTIVNNQTKELLEREINLWEKQVDNANSNDVINILNNYLGSLKNIFNNLSESSKECVFRVGANEGWDFITGAWANKDFDILDKEKWDKLFKMLNKNRKVDIFPKSRKIDEDGDLMGFVKLSI